jgi:hypothetical protein
MPERARRKDRIVVHAEHDDPCISVAPQNTACQFESGDARQVDVDHTQLRRIVRERGLAVLRIRGVIDDDIRIVGEHGPATRHHDGMIIDDQDTELVRRLLCHNDR